MLLVCYSGSTKIVLGTSGILFLSVRIFRLKIHRTIVRIGLKMDLICWNIVFVDNVSSFGDVELVLCGDMNARTADKFPTIVHDNEMHVVHQQAVFNNLQRRYPCTLR
eukprot:TRINITY_DN77773_c0_g1_i1.p1 TRINITY_DN77773_c0_g1~~TRINITY_DN77773_c0_g1_i1.p1  ORF type:complete len:108 (+),score=2.88 TRINITY_DN77773_c0_g1_i1:227-550(+)